MKSAFILLLVMKPKGTNNATAKRKKKENLFVRHASTIYGFNKQAEVYLLLVD